MMCRIHKRRTTCRLLHREVVMSWLKALRSVIVDDHDDVDLGCGG